MAEISMGMDWGGPHDIVFVGVRCFFGGPTTKATATKKQLYNKHLRRLRFELYNVHTQHTTAVKQPLSRR